MANYNERNRRFCEENAILEKLCRPSMRFSNLYQQYQLRHKFFEKNAILLS